MTGKKTAFLVLAALFITFFSGCRREEKIFFEVSEDTVTVYGYVKDYTGNPIEDAEITILPTGDKIKSEKDGLYRFSIGLGELPADAVITYVVEKSGFVPSRASISFSELLIGTNTDIAVQKRVKRQDVVLFPPAEIEVEVVDKDNKPVAGSRVLVLPSPQIALYLGVSLNESVASITSQTSPVKITSGIPAIDFVQLLAFPPQGSEEDYDISTAQVNVSQIKTKGKVVLQLKPLEIVYSSVAVGQFISPDENIKLIFSKEITGINAQLICNGSPVNLTANITGAEVEIDPAGRILGNCLLTVNNAFGEKGETLTGPYFYNFIAYDPNAPRGLACPDITPYLPGSVTAVSFEPPLFFPPPFLQVIYYSPAPDRFDGFIIGTDTQTILIWDPPAVRGIKEFKVKYLKESEKLKGSGIWQEPTAGVVIQYIPHLNKWVANLNFTSLPFDISFGEKYYIAVVPVNLNDEEVCNPENIPTPFTIQDNTPPRITNCLITTPNYSAGTRTIQVQFSERLTSAKSITITSRNFEVIKISEVFDPLAFLPSLQLQVYLEPLSARIPDRTANSDLDEELVLLEADAKKLWVGENVDIKDASGIIIFTGGITAILEKGGGEVSVWFNVGVPNVINGAVVPQTGNLLQSPNNRNLYVLDAAGKRLEVSDATGLTIGDRIQVADPFSNTRKILTIKSVNSATSEITVEEDISDLKCNSNNKLCLFRSFNPDVSIKVEAYDTSGNLISSLADQCSVDGGIIW